MSDPAAPWWAEVQHLRPREDDAPASAPSAPRTPSRRFARDGVQPEAAIATLEHETAEPWTDDVDLSRPGEPETASAAAASPVWDDSLEEAFARTPSWSDDDAWLLPKGADRIENGRRTIEIRGQVDRVHGFTTPTDSSVATRSGRRPGRRAAARFERRPDRVAMWAFLLGVLLIIVAVFSKPGNADAATFAAAGIQQPTATPHVLVVARDTRP